MNIFELIFAILILWALTWLTTVLASLANFHLALASLVVVGACVTILSLAATIKRRIRPPSE